jgi:hypothetical protein
MEGPGREGVLRRSNVLFEDAAHPRRGCSPLAGLSQGLLWKGQ